MTIDKRVLSDKRHHGQFMSVSYLVDSCWLDCVKSCFLHAWFKLYNNFKFTVRVLLVSEHFP